LRKLGSWAPVETEQTHGTTTWTKRNHDDGKTTVQANVETYDWTGNGKNFPELLYVHLYHETSVDVAIVSLYSGSSFSWLLTIVMVLSYVWKAVTF